MENTQSSFQELGRDMKGIRREYDNDPNEFLHKLLSVQNISISGGDHGVFSKFYSWWVRIL
ncbi:hypothetical protein ACRN9F_21305 [Shewanella oncorhynchi]|uniref:hypothetical protein n=1 Tax=Shewanella oncorhynchi TaxID=2726434 RepID=UPI003D79FF7B